MKTRRVFVNKHGFIPEDIHVGDIVQVQTGVLNLEKSYFEPLLILETQTFTYSDETIMKYYFLSLQSLEKDWFSSDSMFFAEIKLIV